MPRSAKVCHQISGWKHSVQPSSRQPRRQASSSARRHAAVAARQHAFEQAALDVVLLDLDRLAAGSAAADTCPAQSRYSRVCMPFH